MARQLNTSRLHRREDIYTIAGNHDASGPTEKCQWWFRKWVDPMGDHPEHSGVRRDLIPFPITGSWERYSFRVGNLLLLMMSDRNDSGPPAGRGESGGYPGGVVTDATFEWWRDAVSRNPDSIIVSAHHYVLRETTVASGPWEGFVRSDDGAWTPRYHGYFPSKAPHGASYLCWIGRKADAQSFEQHLEHHPSAVDLWLGGHTHTNPGDRTGGRSHIEQKWGVTFVNVAAMTRHHVHRTTVPMSRLVEFEEGLSTAKIRCYLHTDDYAPRGWHAAAERTVRLSKPFVLG